jgi:hypothetical protein
MKNNSKDPNSAKLMIKEVMYFTQISYIGSTIIVVCYLETQHYPMVLQL